MSFFDALAGEVQSARAHWLLLVFVVTVLAVRALARPGTVKLRALVFFMVLHWACLLTASVLQAAGSELAAQFQVPAVALGGVGACGMVGALVFGVLLPRVKVVVPKILQDVTVAIASLVVGLSVLSHAGVNLSGLIATSAVATAIIGFSLQDVIGNVAGGLALQLDTSLEVGDWVKVGDVSGKVTEIRWRYTAIETRNWETVLLPNTVLLKSQVTVLGRRAGQPSRWRRWVYFNVDYRFDPPDVIHCVTQALHAAKLERVSSEPLPSVVLMELGESYGRYAVRYWLTDFAADDPTDSEVRALIVSALARQGMRLSIPAHAIFVTEESKDREEEKLRKELDKRQRVLAQSELFKGLSPAELETLAKGLRFAPFRRGEVVTRQGAEAHWLYLVAEGQVAVKVADQGVEREVAQLGPNTFFGEMGLLTGEKRAATVVALTDVDCFRLEKDAFREALNHRPELAAHVAKVLAERRVGLEAAKENLSQAAALARKAMAEADLLGKIRGFFGLVA
ncbi:MAG: mechanosensitive ion channel family protein [Myxococcaceae bacterium]|nr:mechanosensitive ion channel family protein [Myxococcaceae bacterium]